MRGFQFDVKGNWAHFRKPETNNNPLTHDFITKTALIGMIGAVLGIERKEMANLFPQFSEDFLYGVCVKNAVRKESWAFTLRYVVDFFQKAPKQMEFLKKPENRVALALQNERSATYFDAFQTAVEKQEAKFTPVLGLHNCPAELSFVSKGEFNAGSGDFTTKGFIIRKPRTVDNLPSQHSFNSRILYENLETNKNFTLGLERIPTFQDDNFWNKPDYYVEVTYPSEGNQIYANGDYFQFSDKSQWTLI
ncbi:MAG: CRISPR-associated protein Cas5 [Acidobacteriota bacterium]|nr:CRISPR-associated protein Cas5 [Acidobacteriota bacterium]